MDIRLVLVTFPGLEQAREIGTQMVNSQLAACVNLIPCLTSIYRWQGAVEEATEVMAMFKTTAAVLPHLQKAIQTAHPYDTPEIVTLLPEQVEEHYAHWVRASVTMR